jgi:hypothetical protein
VGRGSGGAGASHGALGHPGAQVHPVLQKPPQEPPMGTGASGAAEASHGALGHPVALIRLGRTAL